MKTTLPTDSAERKNYPLLSGALRYAPAAFALMAKTSKLGNDKHNPGQELHHARGKSADHGDCVIRHLMDVQDIIAALDRNDDPEVPVDAMTDALSVELGQLQWRTSMYVQETAEKYLGAPLAPGAKLPVETPVETPEAPRMICGHLDQHFHPNRIVRCFEAPGHSGPHAASYDTATSLGFSSITWSRDLK